MSKKKDYLIEEYEERLKKIDDLWEIINNPEPDRLLSRQRELEKELKKLKDKKTQNYKDIKNIIQKRGVQLLIVHLPQSGPKVAYFTGEWSQAGHPKLYYGVDTCFPITTSRGVSIEDITPKEFMGKLMEDPEQDLGLG